MNNIPPLTSDTPGGSPRPSLARTSISTQATPRTLSSHSQSYGVGWEHQSNDIRNDLASGWGGDGDVGIGGVGRNSGRVGNGSVAAASRSNSNDHDNTMDDDWGWRLHSKAVRPIPPFYPVDARSIRRVYLTNDNNNKQQQGEGGEDEMKMDEDTASNTIKEVSRKISSACQSLSIYGVWNNNSPSAKLSSMERVEMEINIYLGDASTGPSPQVLLVELQRRKGCSITFHNYRRCLLDAAEGKFDPASFHKSDGLDKPAGRDRCNQPRATLGRPVLARPSPSPSSGSRPSLAKPSLSPSSRPSLARPTLSPPGSCSVSRPSPMGRPSGLSRPSPLRPPAMDSPSSGMARPSLRSPLSSANDASIPVAGLKTEGDSPCKGNDDSTAEKALKALNMAASLIKKDRVDARRLGMESLVLLTDPLRAGMETAKIASRVVLLGSANDNSAAMGNDEDDVDALFDESAGLGIREAILEMIMSDNDAEETMDSEDDLFGGIEKEFTDSLFNLCLTVLSNALHAIEASVKAGAAPPSNTAAPSNNHIRQDDDIDDDRKPSPCDSLSNSPGGARRRAATEPSVLPSGVPKQFIEDTSSAFGCDVLSSLIRILGQAKTNPHDAYHSARCLGVLFKGCGNSHKARARKDLDAKRIIAAALEVGSRSHAKLEDASRVAMMALVTDDEESVEEEGEGENTEMENERLEEETEGQQQHDDLSSDIGQSMSADSDERL
mmetsp:Transcript_39091/g.84298  ORF Transcript_39091/g.84298 Transcript_39091/m.84298 type:complete len:723 (+) Transcript_39091:638-2806(+)